MPSEKTISENFAIMSENIADRLSEYLPCFERVLNIKK